MLGCMTTRESLHRLVDRIPEESLPVAERALADIAGELQVSLRQRLESVPFDDEPLTPEDIATIEAGWRSLRAGSGIPDDDLNQHLNRA
jgi:hypothetical protein